LIGVRLHCEKAVSATSFVEYPRSPRSNGGTIILGLRLSVGAAEPKSGLFPNDCDQPGTIAGLRPGTFKISKTEFCQAFCGE
jgi:hypothetical protein